MIKIICLGKIKDKNLEELINEYQKRICKYYKLEIIELSDEGKLDIQSTIRKESEKILKNIDTGYNILLDREGVFIDSISLAKKIENSFIKNPNINFIIGGSYGVSKDIKDKVDLVISFSKLTFPHQLFRLILLEQIYRSCKIINNEEYHK